MYHISQFKRSTNNISVGDKNYWIEFLYFWLTMYIDDELYRLTHGSARQVWINKQGCSIRLWHR